MQLLTSMMRIKGSHFYTMDALPPAELDRQQRKTEDLHLAAKVLTCTLCHDIISHVETLEPDIKHMKTES